MSFKLKRTKQCAKCPWKCSTNPHEIPDGYSVDRHRALKSTISDGSLRLGGAMSAMACHYSDYGAEEYCIGWLENQLGPGNNIGLRIQMMSCKNIRDIETYGPQHKRFEQTLPA